MTKVFDDYKKKLCLEKLVIGLEEPILIKGVGEFLAKVDSGNGGYNVIHGQDVIQQGDVITFKTYDHNEQPKMISKKLKEFINVNIGSGNVEERPVIELDVKFAGDMYKKIPFSVANRNSNAHKVLICKDFVEKELEALIDVSGKLITKDDKVEVEYVKEAVMDNLGVSKDTQDIIKDERTGKVQKAKQLAKKGGWNVLKGMQQAGKIFDTSTVGTDIDPAVIKGYADQAAEDSALIKKRVVKMDGTLFGFPEGKKIKEDDILCFKLVDYLGKYFGGEDVVPSEKQMFDEYQQMFKNGMGNQKKDLQADKYSKQEQQDKKSAAGDIESAIKKMVNNTQKNESFIENLDRLLTEATTDNNQQSQEQQQSDNQQQQEVETNGAEGQEVASKMANYEKLYKSRNSFFTWFVLVKPDIMEKKNDWNARVTRALSAFKLKEKADKAMIDLGNKSVSSKTGSIQSLFKEVSDFFKGNDEYKELTGTFAFCYTKGGLILSGSRKVDMVEAYNITIKQAEQTQQYNPDDIKKDYDDLKNRWRENAFLKNVKLDINGNYNNEEKRNELKEIASKNTEKEEENEETIIESFGPYITKYLNRLYGHSFFITEDASEAPETNTEEQKQDEEVEEKQPKQESEGEDMLADVDFMSIASKFKNQDEAAKAAQEAENELTSLTNTIQKGYTSFDNDTKKKLALEPYNPEETKDENDYGSKEEIKKEIEKKEKEQEEIISDTETIFREIESSNNDRRVILTQKDKVEKKWIALSSKLKEVLTNGGINKFDFKLSNVEESLNEIEKLLDKNIRKAESNNNYNRVFYLKELKTNYFETLKNKIIDFAKMAQNIANRLGEDIDEIFDPIEVFNVPLR